MGKGQRVKGSVFEREVAAVFSAALGQDFKRNIGQARDGGNDIDVGPLVVECKRRKTMKTVYDWMRQAQAAAAPRQIGLFETAEKIPVVVARADAEKPLVILGLDDFVALAKDEVARRLAATPGRGA